MPLKRHPALIPLSHDHQRGLFAANLIRSGAPRYPGLPTDLPGKWAYLGQYYQKNLKQHWAWEEALLWPLARNLSEPIADLVEELAAERGRLREWLLQLPPADAPDLQAHFDLISQGLQQHIRRQERQLFEGLQVEMAEADLIALGERIAQARL